MDHIYVYELDQNGSSRNVFSVLPREYVFDRGLPQEAIIGALTTSAENGGEATPDNFSPNGAFIEFLHQFVGAFAPKDKNLQNAAALKKEGWVYVVDARSPDPQGEVPPEDIIGAFEVKEGAVLAGSYRGNAEHILFSSLGFFRLPHTLHDQLVAELKTLET